MAHYGDGDTDFNESVKALKEIGCGCVLLRKTAMIIMTGFLSGTGIPSGSVREDVRL